MTGRATGPGLDGGLGLGAGLQAGLYGAPQKPDDLTVQASLLPFGSLFERRMQVFRDSDERSDELCHEASVLHLATTPLLCYYHCSTKVATRYLIGELMDYRETCRCGGNMMVAAIEDPDEVRRMVNTWRKYHACAGVRVDRETGEITSSETVEELLSR